MAIYYGDGSNSNTGRIVQVVNATSSTYTMVTSSGYADLTNNYLDITPKDNSNTLVGWFGGYLNNRDNDADSRIKFKVVKVISGNYTNIFYPNLNEGANAHQWISKRTNDGSTDTDMWSYYCMNWMHTLPSSGATVSTRFQLQAGTAGTSDSVKTLGFYATIMEVAV